MNDIIIFENNKILIEEIKIKLFFYFKIKNLEIIKYLLENANMNPYHTNNSGFNCLAMGCANNTNLEIIRYLVEVIGILEMPDEPVEGEEDTMDVVIHAITAQKKTLNNIVLEKLGRLSSG